MIGLRFIARSRLRLAAVALLGYGVVFGAARPLSTWIRTTSSSPGDDLLVLAGWLFCLLPASVSVAILIGERLFGAEWRERFVLEEGILSRDDPTAIVVPPRKRWLPFAALVGIQVLGCAWGLEALTGGFFDEYGRVGYSRTVLRGGDDAQRIRVLEDLAGATYQDQVRDALELTTQVWRDPEQPLEVRVAAVRTMGRLAHSLRSAVVAWREAENRTDTWELTVLRALREDVAHDLIAGLDASEPTLARASALALGKVQPGGGGEALVRCVGTHEAGSPAWRGCVIGLGLRREGEDALAALALATATPPSEPDAVEDLAWASTMLVWSFTRFDDERKLGDVVEANLTATIDAWAGLLTAKHVRARCAAIAVLSRTRDSRIGEPLMAAFDDPRGAETCPAWHVQIDERAEELVEVDGTLRGRAVQALSRIVVGDRQVLRWARRQQKNADVSEHVRGLLASMIDQAERAD